MPDESKQLVERLRALGDNFKPGAVRDVLSEAIGTIEELEDQLRNADLCNSCGGTGSVRVHGPEDYGISFESEECASCMGLGTTRAARKAERQAAVLEALTWAVRWIEHCAEVPVPGDEQEDWEHYDAAKELALQHAQEQVGK